MIKDELIKEIEKTEFPIFIKDKAKELINLAYQKNRFFFYGKRKKSLLASFIYISYLFTYPRLTQKEIAKILKTNTVTIRTLGRKIAKMFPEIIF